MERQLGLHDQCQQWGDGTSDMIKFSIAWRPKTFQDG